MSIDVRRDTEGALVAHATVRVGLGKVELQLALDPWHGPDPDPAGLRQRPVVVVDGSTQVALAVAGIRRSGRLEPQVIVSGPHLGADLLTADADATVVQGIDAATLEAIRCLGGRPLPALPLWRVVEARELVQACRVDLDVALPSFDEAAREAARAAALTLGLDVGHHLVEIDPRPAFDELGRAGDVAPLEETLAACVGVLAGRLASSNRRWREQG